MNRNSIALFIALALAGCDALQPTEYVPEVGYREGEREVWWIGDRYRSKDDCINRAVARFNALNVQSPGRAFSWACRVMKGESFEDRTR